MKRFVGTLIFYSYVRSFVSLRLRSFERLKVVQLQMVQGEDKYTSVASMCFSVLLVLQVINGHLTREFRYR